MTHPLVLITEPLSPVPLDWLGDRCQVESIGVDDDRFEDSLAQAQGLIVRTYTQVDAGLLSRAPNLRVVGRAGVGIDNIDLQACADRGIRVVHTPHSNAMAVVEYTVSMLIQALRPIHPISKALSKDQWRDARERAISPGSVVGSSLGVVGFGHIGSRVARAAMALGMEVGFNDLRSIEPGIAGDARAESLDDLLTRSRCVCLHVDGRAENRGMIGDREFGLMRPDVVLMNASRGFVVDPVAAARFARSNPDARLVLDVHDPEPIDPGSELLNLENVTLTPHIAAATRQAKEAMSWVVRDVLAVLNGDDPEFAAL